MEILRGYVTSIFCSEMSNCHILHKNVTMDCNISRTFKSQFWQKIQILAKFLTFYIDAFSPFKIVTQKHAIIVS